MMKTEKQSLHGCRLLITPKCSLPNTEESNSIVALMHPRTGKRVHFLVKESQDHAQIFELNNHCEDPSSWLINDEEVRSDGSLLLSTPFDPLYILLSPLYHDETNKFLLLDQLFSSTPSLTDVGSMLIKCLSDVSQMDNIAECAGNDELIAYRYNEAKTLHWLKCKVEQTVKAVTKSRMFIPTDEDLSQEEEIIRFACGVVSDYLPVELSKRLLQHMGIAEKREKRKSCGNQSSSKKLKGEPIDDYSKENIKKVKSVSKKTPRMLKKVDIKGMKTMSSFFVTKPKT